MTPWLQDQDLTVWCGDALETLRGMADGSVDCVVTSPPYWGLRDYGTGEWAGGEVRGCEIHDLAFFHADGAKNDPPGTEYPPCAECCDHTPHVDYGTKNDTSAGAIRGGPFKDVCRKCGAQRVDQQHGLEATPDLYVTRMVEVFREVRRVLAPHGTCWLNLGDSYVSTAQGTADKPQRMNGMVDDWRGSQRVRPKVADLKPKDLVGIPWRVAFALQADGWWLRSDIIWAKPNPMPESVTDRPTKAHEYVFLLTRGPRYWFDQEAVREPAAWERWGDQTNGKHEGSESAASWIGSKSKAELRSGRVGRYQERAMYGEGDGTTPRKRLDEPQLGRNVRSVWEIPTQPYPEAHFATFPEELARRCIVAGCPVWVCGVCGKPRERIVVATGADNGRVREDVGDWIRHKGGNADGKRSLSGATYKPQRAATDEWSDCGHQQYRPGVVLDPFGGSGTVAAVARKHGRRAVLIELNEAYCELIARRTQQQSLFA